MYKLTSSKQEVLTPKRAEGFLAINTFAGQRPLNEATAQRYAAVITAGAFRRGEIATAICPDGSKVLMNGQHQCRACVLSGNDIPVIVDTFKCYTWEDVWHLFGTFDVHRGRTELNIMKAARGLFPSQNLQNMPLRILSVCGSALVFLGGGVKPNFRATAMEKTRKPDLVQKYEADVMIFAKYPEDIYNQITVGIATAMIVTHRLNKTRSTEFWDRVLFGDELKRNSPQWKLHQALFLNDSLRNTKRRTSGGQSLHIVAYSVCILWWNAFLDGTDRKIVKVGAMKGVPEARAA
jgi:hypothetical protein